MERAGAMLARQRLTGSCRGRYHTDRQSGALCWRVDEGGKRAVGADAAAAPLGTAPPSSGAERSQATGGQDVSLGGASAGAGKIALRAAP
jgi:hypothetical protein